MILSWHLGNWIQGEFSLFPNWLEWLTGPNLFVQTIRFMLNTCFSSGRVEFGIMPSKGATVWAAPGEIWDTESLMSFLVDSIPRLSHLGAGNEHVLGRTQGKTLGSACLAFSPSHRVLSVSLSWLSFVSFCYIIARGATGRWVLWVPIDNHWTCGWS